MSTEHRWRERRRIVLQTAKVYDRLDVLINDAKQNRRSLAVFKPKDITGFICKEDEREWDPVKLSQMLESDRQLGLFSDDMRRRPFKIIPKLPYSFSYRFADVTGRASEMQILDWEIGALYWNCLGDCVDQEEGAIEKVRQKYLDQFLGTDLHFFLGTTKQWHSVGPNPWVIVGVFPIPHEDQLDLFG